MSDSAEQAKVPHSAIAGAEFSVLSPLPSLVLSCSFVVAQVSSHPRRFAPRLATRDLHHLLSLHTSLYLLGFLLSNPRTKALTGFAKPRRTTFFPHQLSESNRSGLNYQTLAVDQPSPPPLVMASVEELARKYSSQLSQLQAIFPSWDESDLAFTLQDAKGNVEEAAMAITEGMRESYRNRLAC